jgi:hypothetical protein
VESGLIKAMPRKQADDSVLLKKLVASHPGLCAHGEFYASWEILQSFFIGGKDNADFIVLSDFRQIMSYGVRCPIDAFNLQYCLIKKPSVREVPDFFNNLEEAYALKSEKSAVKLAAESKNCR